MGGPQTRAFVLHPVGLPLPAEPLVGAEAINALLRSWRPGAPAYAADGVGEPAAMRPSSIAATKAP